MEELTVMKLSLMWQAFFHKYVSFTGIAHLQKEGPMCFSLLESLAAPSYTEYFDLAFHIWVLGLQIRDRYNLFIRVDPAGSDGMSYNHKYISPDAGLASNH